MENFNVVPFLLFFLGVTGRIVLPYIVKKIQEKDLQFDWYFLLGQIGGALVAVIPLFAQPEWVNQIMTSGFSAIIIGWGWFAGDIGRESQKLLKG